VVAEFVVASTKPGSRLAALESAHRLVSTLDAAMVLLNPVVEIAAGPMARTVAEFGLDRPWVAVVPVRRDPGRHDAGDRFGGAEECPGGSHVACFAQPDVHESARGVDGAIEIASAALDFDVDPMRRRPPPL